MNDQIKVYVIDKGRKFLYLRYTDPLTGKPVEKSSKTAKPKAALEAAGAWQAELREGRYQKPHRMTWEAFRDSYSTNAMPGLATRSVEAYESTLNIFEKHCNPQKLADVTTGRVTEFVSSLRRGGASEATIAHRLRHLKASMRWASRQGLLISLPKFDMPKRVKGAKVMRGRPITTEEFERMLAAVPKAIEARPTTSAVDTVAPWRFYLRGLWESGLRLSESIDLRWDDAPGAIVVDLTSRRPMLRIPAEAEKGHRDRVLPMTPQFATLLETVPEGQRRGRVFKLLAIDGKRLRKVRTAVGKIVTAIGTAAGVVVDERTKRVKATADKPAHDATVRKFASAHDLRRAFGQRWAGKVMPTVLRELMRHSEIGTTMKFYVGENAEATAEALWATLGDTLGDTSQRGESENSKNPYILSGGHGTRTHNRLLGT